MSLPGSRACAPEHFPLLYITLLGVVVVSTVLSFGAISQLGTFRLATSHTNVVQELYKQKHNITRSEPSMEELWAGPHLMYSMPPSVVAQHKGVADPSVVYYRGYYIAAYANAFGQPPLVRFALSINGSSWEPASTSLSGLKWISLFVYQDVLYLIGTQHILWELSHAYNELQLVQLTPPPALKEVSRVNLTQGLAVHVLNNVPLVQPDRVFFPFMVALSATRWDAIEVKGYISAAGQEGLLGEGLRALHLGCARQQGEGDGRAEAVNWRVQRTRPGEGEQNEEHGTAGAAGAAALSNEKGIQGDVAENGEGAGVLDVPDGRLEMESCSGVGRLHPKVHIVYSDWDQVVFGVAVGAHPLGEGTFVRLEERPGATGLMATDEDRAFNAEKESWRAGQLGAANHVNSSKSIGGGKAGNGNDNGKGVESGEPRVVYARVVGVEENVSHGGGVLWLVPQRWNASCWGQAVGWACKSTVGVGGEEEGVVLTTGATAIPDTPLYQEFYLSYLDASNVTSLMDEGAWQMGRFVGNPIAAQPKAHRLWAGGSVQERREGGELRRCTSTGGGESVYWQEPVAFASAHTLQPQVAVRITTDQNCNAAILCNLVGQASSGGDPKQVPAQASGQLQCSTMAPVPGFGNVRGFLFYDPPSGLYWAVSNFNTNTNRGGSGKSFKRLGRCIDERGNMGVFYTGDMHNWVLAQVVAASNSNHMHLMYVSCAVGVPAEGGSEKVSVGRLGSRMTHQPLLQHGGKGPGVGREDLLCVARSNGKLAKGMLAVPEGVGDNHDSYTVISFRISDFRSLAMT